MPLLGGELGGKGLSVGVHIWEPLAHSCPLSACLRMDLDGTGWEGLGGRFAPADGNPDGSGRRPGPAGGKGPGEALPGRSSPVPPDLRAQRPADPAYPTSPRLGPQSWRETVRYLGPRPGCATGARVIGD